MPFFRPPYRNTGPVRATARSTGFEAVGNQLIVAAPLNQPALVKDEDIATKPAGGKAVGNVNGCFVPDNLIEMGIDLKLGKVPRAAVGSSRMMNGAFL